MGGFYYHRSGLLVALVLLTAFVAGCGDSNYEDAEKAEAGAEKVTEESAPAEVVAALSAAEEALVQKMAAIATALDEAPATAAAVLAQNSLTIEEYEAEIFKIAADPALSAAFEKAKNR